MFDQLLLSPEFHQLFPLFRSLIVSIAIFVAISFLMSFLQARLLKKARTKKHISNLSIFSRTVRYITLFLLVVVFIATQVASIANISLVFGFVTAALGFALQRPLTGVAAWIMVIVRRPFEIGDRVIIGTVRGNVTDITISHIYLEEVGRYGGEEISGRTIIIPNSKLFEENITNYSLWSDYVLGQVIMTVPFESNLDHAIEIAIAAAWTHAGEYLRATSREPHVRLLFEPSGVAVRARYSVPFNKAQLIASNITKEMYDRVKEATDVELAYLHTSINVVHSAGLADGDI